MCIYSLIFSYLKDFKKMLETTFFDTLATNARKIDFNPEWAVFLKYAVEGGNAPVLHSGEIVSCTDPEGRRFVIIAIERSKNIIFYERYKLPKFKYIIDIRMPKIYEKAFTITHDIDLGGLITCDKIRKVCAVLKDTLESSSYIRYNGTKIYNTYFTDFLKL